MKTSLLVFAASLLITGLAPAQDVIVGDIIIDKNEWGSRTASFSVENTIDDTARLYIVINTVYPQHYLSGLEKLETDSIAALGPKEIKDFVIPFKLHGSFERVVTRVLIFRRFDNYAPDRNIPDSTYQMFHNIFRTKGDANAYAGRKHSIGPVYSVMDHFLMNFDYPRLVLFLLSRGMSKEEISTFFEADVEYTDEVISDLGDDGFFPLEGDKLAPGILAIDEKEGYGLKTMHITVAEAFYSWYENVGRKELGRLMEDAGLDPYVSELPSLQIPILLALMMEKWIDPKLGVDILRFEDKDQDLKAHNMPRWIAQGGEFFLPKLCLAAFEEGGELHFATFSPDPSLPYDKACIYDLRGAVEKEAGSIIMVKAEQIREVMAEAREKQLIDELVNETITKVVASSGAQAVLKQFKPYQEPYLADYICRTALGEYFVEHLPGDGLDCIRVEF
jgi:hypothetical protein